MIILLSGASHTGKTALAQRLLEHYHIPYYSLDHIKMGLIRSQQTTLSVEDDEALTPYLWSIVKEIIKTTIENKQHLILEGCYIPCNWTDDFEASQLSQITFHCLIMSERYIKLHYESIRKHANTIEQRIDDSYCTKQHLIAENKAYLAMCKEHNYPYTWIDETYTIDIENVYKP